MPPLCPVNSEGRKTYGSAAQRSEEERSKIISLPGFWNKKRIIRSVIDIYCFQVKRRVAAVHIGANGINCGCGDLPQRKHFLHGAARGISDAGSGNAALGQL